MKRLLSVVAVNMLLLCALVFAQQPGATSVKTPEAAAIKAEAESSGRAFASGDYGKVVDLTYPKVIELGGGRDKVLVAMEAQLKEMREMGMKVVALTVGEPEKSVRAGSKLLAIVPIALKMESRDYIIEQKSFWLAVSEDEGKTWRFISGAALNADALKFLLPEAVDKIKLPAASQPSMERKPANPKASGTGR